MTWERFRLSIFLLRLSLAEASSSHQGESVVAMGNPGDAMLFRVMKGIVSAVGPFPTAGPGSWIQTDAVFDAAP